VIARRHRPGRRDFYFRSNFSDSNSFAKIKIGKGEAMADYKHPDVLVSTEWVSHNLNAPNTRLVEVDVDTSAYDQGHIPGAVGWNWQTQLQDNVRRDLIDSAALEALLGKSGIGNDTTILLYGDNNNWFAAYAFWQLKYHGHKDVRLINGGRKKWLEEKRATTTELPNVAPTTYKAGESDDSIRAYRDDVRAVVEGKKKGQLVDVRSVDEFTGKIIAPPGMTETAQRAGHIPTAANIPWAQAAAEDGTFKSADALAALYQGEGVTGTGVDETIAYCRIGERSSHTWFVLKYLLGYDNVKNYDGSWTEWGNLIGAPVVNETVRSAKAAGAK
jgi:thiosulfate/3-mercaptopyruvate sulfurtransferase